MNNYTEEHGAYNYYDWEDDAPCIKPDTTDFFIGATKEEDELFHIGESDHDTVTTLVCKLCGSRNFNVGRGGYFTAIKCVVCKWEACVHSG